MHASIDTRGAWRVLVCMGALLAGGAPGAAEPTDPAAAAASPLEVVRTTVDGVLAVLADPALGEDSRKRQVKALIGEHFDFTAMANRVLATNWRKATPAERSRFTSLFRELLSNTYWARISGYTNERVEYLGERQRSEQLATVSTVIKTDTVEIPVDYKLYQRAGRWLAYDVVIEQVSLVRNYRGSFQDIVRERGVAGLISELETKVAASSGAEE
jgi:phospholipid transport system substrate-binding protein